MLKITVANYPAGSTASSIELVPEAELPGPVENYWVSEQPIDIPHTFDIDRSFYPLRITLFMVVSGYQLVYEFQGTHPDQPNYKEVNIRTPGDYTYDVAAEALQPAVNPTRLILVVGAIALAGVVIIAATRRKR